jgi:hypothetical protein
MIGAMKTSATNAYRVNRGKFTLTELEKLKGLWVAFSTDGQSEVASAPTVAELANQVRARHVDLRHVVLEHVEIDSTDTNLGAAELM